jgi:hypothetical protein
MQFLAARSQLLEARGLHALGFQSTLKFGCRARRAMDCVVVLRRGSGNNTLRRYPESFVIVAVLPVLDSPRSSCGGAF